MEIDTRKLVSLSEFRKQNSLSLKDLRTCIVGKTQTDMAKALDMTQSQYSRLEHRNDHLVSMLNRCAVALGGRLEITIVIENKRYPLLIQTSETKRRRRRAPR